MKAIYPSDGDDARPDAVPGLQPEAKMSAASRTLEVDGEVFALRPNELGGTHYAWLTGPHTGYGFGTSPTVELSFDEHIDNIRSFLAMVDPTTGYIEDD
ncbi:hypothetical protein Ato02nite_099350 [Paractinoplanes toevensis]|uniref:Uncharacterized protein n=2 Tax=Paractinoplanes toevensis TaxID=571911 RepID=A0A920BR69_9ACTN|nr:hypothetical protein Ato02nite_099350 [Actinoplanes toevensis]